jgi:hypothetical protein
MLLAAVRRAKSVQNGREVGRGDRSDTSLRISKLLQAHKVQWHQRLLEKHTMRNKTVILTVAKEMEML